MTETNAVWGMCAHQYPEVTEAKTVKTWEDKTFKDEI